ncbi:MAG TPA: hypothetical protein ENH10_09000 [Bacteroidetes bacterium]|nr:hypothetical protein [Bacteroidota bacterium]HEX05272.1 hypothetical protein [Bacteroidota bacterium]
MPRFRIDDSSAAHYLTFSCQQRRPLFNDSNLCDRFLIHLDKVRSDMKFELMAYVIMPSHIHLLIYPDTLLIRNILYRIKQPFSYQAGQYLAEISSGLHRKLHVKRGTKWSFRFWLWGGGYDRLLYTNEEIQEKIKYIHRDPIRSGLVDLPDEYPWSSFHAYADPVGKPIPIDRPDWI